MIPGLRGRLISWSFVRDRLPALPGVEPAPASFARALERWAERTEATIGPASAVRAVAEAAVVPLLELLELRVTARHDDAGACRLGTEWRGRRGPDVLVVGWGGSLARAWRPAVVGTLAGGGRWALCTDGTALRFVDARRAWSREFVELDLRQTGEQEAQLLWTLARGASIAADPPLLDLAVDASARHGAGICRSLGAGVMDALAALVSSRPAAGRRPDPRTAPETIEQAITVLYRMLFLLFAEARGLVPVWHPIYRERYSLDTIVTTVLAGRPCRGLWPAVQAMVSLARQGCAAGSLTVNAFNGGLFAASGAGVFDRAGISDAVMARAILALSTQTDGRPRGAAAARGRRTRVLYRDLDVEQLGAVYERVLEYTPSAGPGPALVRSRDARTASGTFYTPRPVAAHLVRRTLAPLVEGRSAAQILDLRVLDPAMGSGAFLVAACRFLAAAAEDALVRDGRWHAGDVTRADRIALRREVALRCLYGVDLNPMAVQLARLSLWLAALAADRPLSFLDHHLIAGDSLVGATPHDVLRRPTRMDRRRGRPGELPLFPESDLEADLRHTVGVRRRLSLEPDDSAEAVRRKTRELAAIRGDGTALARWTRLLDLWCAGWFWTSGAPPDRSLFADLARRILEGQGSLPARALEPWLAHAASVASARRFLHWPLAFPEVFSDEDGRRRPAPGFDAVVGNPPWDMVRGDSGVGEVRAARRTYARQLGDFTRESGVYRVQAQAHVNRYQLFVERALQLVRAGGRIGLVLPAGLASDAGASALRRHLFDRAAVDAITGLDNRAGIFPIHRSVRFALVTGTAGRPTEAMACRFGLTRSEALDDPSPARAPVVLTRRLLARLSGEDDLGIPELASARDLRIVEGMAARIPRLGDPQGWHAAFGRELNASDDRGRFRRATGAGGARPVVEGKQIEPFRLRLEHCRFELRPGAEVPARVGSRDRLAYRDVASATNRLTLIAAIVPARAVTTHTLFCLKTPLPSEAQHVLCALLNSFVANYLVRLRVHTHVTVSLVARLPVPPVPPGHDAFGALASASRALARAAGPLEEAPEYPALQALCARLYGLDAPDFEHVLSTFPLVSDTARDRCLARLVRLAEDEGPPVLT